MSATKQLLTILQDKGPLTVEELVEITGMDIDKVREAIKHMREFGYLKGRPVTYSVTPKGSEHASAPPATEKSKRRLERKKAQQARMRNSMVSLSIQGRPALEKAWGVFA